MKEDVCIRQHVKKTDTITYTTNKANSVRHYVDIVLVDISSCSAFLFYSII